MEINFPTARTIHDVYMDFKGRRQGLIKALTTEIGSMFVQCDPDPDPAKEKMLYGYPNETWELKKPIKDVPITIPEPALGINLLRHHAIGYRPWLSLVAIHSDSRLLAVAFFLAANIPLTKDQRSILFDMINGLPTVHELVTSHMDKSFDIMARLSIQRNQNARGRII